MELGWSYPKRKDRLISLQSRPSNKTYFVPFQGPGEHYPQYKVDSGAPTYRLNNGRTCAAQAEYLALHPDKSSDFFSADPESEEAIKVQHEILKEMNTEADLLTYFRENKQTEPLILTAEGFVLNGNRRLCAMRELLAEDEETYKHFRQIAIVILPPAEERDFDELEARLQILPDIKADYSWFARALMMRTRKNEHSYTVKQLSNLYDMREKVITEFIDMLALGETWLKKREQAHQYRLLEGTEFGFRSLLRTRSGKTLQSEPEKVLFEELSFGLIDETEGGRAYEFIPAIADYFPKIKERLMDEFDLGDSVDKIAEDDDLLGGYVNAEPDIESILSALEKEENVGRARDVVLDVVRSERLISQERKTRNFFIRQLKKAHSALKDAENSYDNDAVVEGAPEQLKAIETSVSVLRSMLDDRNQS
ncbi:MAG: hypothetical protein IH856_15575 [Deltaproteobacteria bacterium]|nr:hypothetical protein [Deltaproteobacteria bacterium]